MATKWLQNLLTSYLGSAPGLGTNDHVTGFTNVDSSRGGKWLEMLKAIAPNIMSVALIFNPETAPGTRSYYFHLIESAAPSSRWR
jgi:hypothetical protein